jgi:quinol monooxygenase YgiN
MSEQIAWCVELAIKPGQLANFRELTEKMVEATANGPGVLIYHRFVSDDSGGPGSRDQERAFVA